MRPRTEDPPRSHHGAGESARPPIGRSETRQIALLWLAAAVSSLALRPLWLAIAPMLRPCTFRTITGVPCPTCGTTTAAVALLNGDVAGSIAANPLAAVAGIAFVVGAPVAAALALTNRPLPSLPRKFAKWERLAIIVGIVVNWIYLIAH